MADSQDGAVGEYGFLYDNTDIDGSLCDAAMRDTYLFDEAVMLVEQKDPELLDVEILHDGVHVVVDAGGRTKVRPFFWTFHLAAFA